MEHSKTDTGSSGRKGRPQEGLDLERGHFASDVISGGEVANIISAWKLQSKEGVMERYLRRR